MKKHTGKILIIALATITAIIYFIASIEINKGIPPTPIEEELLFEVADSCVPAISLKEASREEASREEASRQKEAEKAKEKAKEKVSREKAAKEKASREKAAKEKEKAKEKAAEFKERRASNELE